jgi:predicted transcriptional regulator
VRCDVAKESGGPIATKIRARIKSTKLNYSEISRMSGVPQSSISKFVAGQDITLATAERLLAVLDEAHMGAISAANALEKILLEQQERTVREIQSYIRLFGDLETVEKSLNTLSNFVDKIRASMGER